MRLFTSVVLAVSLLPVAAQAQNPDLTITKSHGGVGFSAGATNATYTVIVQNIGVGAKVAGQLVTVTDTPPAGYTITGMSGSGWVCTTLPTCTRNDALGGAGSYPAITVVGTVALDAVSPLVNTVSVVTTQTESNTANNSATDSTADVLRPDLTITKTHGGVGFNAGSTTAPYSVIVKNNGFGTKVAGQPVTVTDTPSSGFTITAMSGSGWTCTTLPTCTRSDVLSAGGSYPTLTVTGTVAADAATSPLVNTASVVTTQPEGNTANNSATDSTADVLRPDLKITKTHGGDFTAGSTGTYSVVVSNTSFFGIKLAGDVVSVTDTPPAGLTVTAMSGSGWTCTTLPTCTRSDVLMQLSSYPPIVVTVSVALSATSPQVNSVTVSSPYREPSLADNTATDSTNIMGPPTVTKVITAATLVPGGTTTMTITLTNPNAFAITGVALSDTFPAGLVPSAVGGTCLPSPTLAGQTVSVSGVTLAAAPGPGNQCTMSATVTANGAVLGLITNTTGAVTSSAPTLTGGTASDAVVVLAPPATTKAFNPANIAIAGTSVITFTVTNSNPTAMANVAFTDTFPAGLIVSQIPNVTNSCGGTFTAVSNAPGVSLTGGSIAANASCQIKVTVQATVPGALVNTTSSVTATVSATTVTGPTATATLNVAPSQVSFLMRYASNLNVGESYVNFTNSGESSTFSFGGNLAQNGEICANVFAYSPDEQLVSCCSCNVTPNALNSLSVKADLGTNTLTPIIPSSLVIKVVATQGGTACTASSAATVNTAVLQPGLAAWGSTLHALPATGGTTAGTYGVIETPFSHGTITPAELQRMAQLCSFIRANGSGFGICKSCKVGGLGASSK